ncbi:MAG: His/Gly/Thr/Pro-type tRNA ligase C-terminal domain-containing protein, partial [Spirochaetales bacterium]|nr:His/Gly/Thr/Pro-type tRNA ligase C-terminal domain-containing protein [Spirochaetales bacterium]
FQDEDNRTKTPYMGSYGIGLGRLLYGTAESNHDEKGLCWPAELAPFRYFVMGIGKSPTVRDRVYTLAEKLGNQVLVDDRKEGIGVKLRDCDMLGIPCRIIISHRYLEKGEVELYKRSDGSLSYVPYTELIPTLMEWERNQGLR